VSNDPAGYELPLLLLLGFRTIIEDLHGELARRGHPDARPLHGFVCQALGRDGATAAELGRRLGVSKQAAGKTIDALERLGYADRAKDPHDARRKIVMLTPHGEDMLRKSVPIFDALRADWERALGPMRLRALEADLRTVTSGRAMRLDIPGWFGNAA